MTASSPQRLVLVGAGHAHVEILRRFAERPVPDVSLSLVVDQVESVYSGMVPGLVAGDYDLDEVVIPVLPLAERAGAEVFLSAAKRVDAAGRFIELADGRRVSWEVASLDVGSDVRGLRLPGVREHALPTRPIGVFARRLAAALDEMSSRTGGPPRIVVVGGGAAGVELAFTLEARTRRCGSRVSLVCGNEGLLPGAWPAVMEAVRREAAARSIAILPGETVLGVDEAGVILGGVAGDQRNPRVSTNEGSGRLDADLVVWAAGAAPLSLLADSGLATDERGFLRVAPTLEVPGQRGLFAAGDCCAIDGAAWVPKAGVYAVRAGPVLDANLRASLGGGSLREYRPQRDFLSLVNLGDRRALATKWGWVTRGRLAWMLKDHIDRGFVARYRVG
jgi:selenide,water dikinase